jgi:hypothetical protein
MSCFQEEKVGDGGQPVHTDGLTWTQYIWKSKGKKGNVEDLGSERKD